MVDRWAPHRACRPGPRHRRVRDRARPWRDFGAGRSDLHPAGGDGARDTESAPTTTSAAELPAHGKELFASAGCAGCHTLADAGASGSVGPNLDDAKPPAALVVDRVTNGKGAMPSFSGQLSKDEIEALAAYVSQATAG